MAGTPHRPHVSLRKEDFGNVSIAKYAHAAPNGAGYDVTIDEGRLFSVPLGVSDNYISWYNNIDADVVNVHSEVSWTSAQIGTLSTLINSNVGKVDTINTKNNFIFSLLEDSGVNDGRLNIIINDTWYERFQNGYNSVPSYRSVIKSDVDLAITNNSDVNLIKGDSAYIKECCDYNHFHDVNSGAGWLYRYYNPSGSDVVSTTGIFENFYNGYLRFAHDLLYFFKSRAEMSKFLPSFYAGDSSKSVYTWDYFSFDVKQTVDLNKSNLEVLKERIPGNLQTQLSNIYSTSATAAGAANMASDYSQRNSNTLFELRGEVGSVSTDVTHIKGVGDSVKDKVDSLAVSVDKILKFVDEVFPAFKTSIEAEISLAKQYAGNAALNANLCIELNNRINAVVDGISVKVDNIVSNIDDLQGDLSDVKSGVSDVKSGVSDVKSGVSDVNTKLDLVDDSIKDIKDSIEELEPKFKKYFAWVVQCFSIVVSKILVPFARCFSGGVSAVAPADHLQDIIEGVSYGVVDVENLIFNCPTVSYFWPYWPAYEKQKLEETCRFVSEDIGGALAFYYYPIG